MKNNNLITPFQIEIEGTFYNEIQDDYFSIVTISNMGLFKKKIFGASKSQAKNLSISFVIEMLKATSVFDAKGVKINLSQLLNAEKV